MKIVSEISLENFEAWSGGKDTLDRVIEEGKCEELEAILEDLYPDGMTDTQLNDILWFEPETVYEWVGISDEEDAEEEEESEGWTDEKQDAFDDFCGQFEDCEGCPYYNSKTVLECHNAWEADNL